MTYSEKEILENLYFYVEKLPDSNTSNFFVNRIIKKEANRVYLLSIKLEYDSKLEQYKQLISVSNDDIENFNTYFFPAAKMIEDFEFLVFDKNGTKTQFLFDNFSEIGFFKHKNEYRAIDLLGQKNHYKQSEFYRADLSHKELSDAKELILGYINQTEIFDNEKMLSIILDLYNNLSKVLENPTQIDEEPAYSQQDLVEIYENLKSCSTEEAKELVEIIFPIIIEEPTAIIKSLLLANDFYNKNIQVDAYNKPELMNLDFKSKKTILESFLEIYSKAEIVKSGFQMQSDLAENRNYYEDEVFYLYDAMTFLQNEIDKTKIITPQAKSHNQEL